MRPGLGPLERERSDEQRAASLARPGERRAGRYLKAAGSLLGVSERVQVTDFVRAEVSALGSFRDAQLEELAQPRQSRRLFEDPTSFSGLKLGSIAP